jgi:hypothetical protein
VGQHANCTACSFSGRAFFSIVSPLARPSRQSRSAGVAQPASAASALSAPFAWFGPPLLPSVAQGEFQEAIRAASLIVKVRQGLTRSGFCPKRCPAPASGVGHEPKPLPPVRSADAARRNIGRSAGVTKIFEVIENSVDPDWESFRSRISDIRA